MTKMPECYFYSKFGPHCRHRHVRRVICTNYLCGFCPEGPKCKHKHPRFELPLVKDENIDKKLNITCHSCGQPGHKASTCPQNPQKENFKPHSFNQNVPNSMGDQHIFGRRPLETVTCFKCGDKGHYANKVSQRNL
ncbi:hypothetical protein QZH41_012211 [Actinostola sp. cb2023]|nr:hypothetical protein QZH41_012211 [Actinostola sp. cb2023]